MGSSIRGAIADSNTNRASQTIQIASNIKSVELIVNGKSVGKRQTENGLCEWKVSLTNGTNIIKLKAFENGKIYTDQKSIQFQLQPFNLKDEQIPFRQINILLGAKRFFIGADSNLWMPDQEYRKGSWGHIGGKPFTLVNNGRLPYGTDKNIKGTFDDPIYQTLQTGISEYRADVPDGDYELYLHFSELLGNGPLQNIPYNLDTLDRIEPAGKRIFDVIVNDKLLLEEFNITEEFGAATAVVKKFILSVRNGKGIIISFRSIIGEPILNALQIKKINVP
jgi:beta-galactosidase